MRTESETPELNAWTIYLRASEEAKCRGDRRVGTDHLVLALLEEPLAVELLGVSLHQAREALHALDRQALAVVGLDLGADPPAPTRVVPKKPRLRDVAQKDRLRMTPEAKKVLERASKSNRRGLYVTADQVLAQILTLNSPDPAPVLLDALGVNRSEVRRRLELLTSDG
jgi:hypothetical protein